MCPRILCPFVSSTRNIALGSASATVPSISIAPSLLAKRVPTSLFVHGVRRCSLKAVPLQKEIGVIPLLWPDFSLSTRRFFEIFGANQPEFRLGEKIGDFDTKAGQLGPAAIDGR